ncbi:minor capsid protein [Loigolactobacillus coryniformis]|uniref:Uncharacterized protein n=1 Tax=Loigolactobacillus coryniformis subsp. torquens DSM 20004 = KCTC 3535 TaxID=1423822 RepID=A0A2D1KMF3_9LACO|nr:minor capsid protein [Loigolactobacillus coryniformis]ATO43320.1 hypothetical protein LC20004_05105 [Loigolactobacillus coryniformis subsp. torquens DSM 20004 = KCTC 3535]KRK85634.1 phage protein [Loigolactobacillus coryniformis subsp. torquens DSM 20004 = KCTC 3535]
MADQPNSQAYWIKRTTGVMAKLDKTDAVITAALLKTIAAAKDEITDDLASIIQRYADDNGLTYQQAKKQAYKTDLSQYVREANEYRQTHDKDPEVLKRLNTDYFASQVSVLDMLRAQIEFAVLKQTVNFNDQFSDYLKQTAAEVDKRLAEGFANSTLNTSAIKAILANEWSGANYSQRVWRNMDQMAAKLKDSITTGFIRGYGTRDTARRMRPFVRDMDATVKTMRYVTERLVRTESTYVANQAIASRYRADGVDKYEFIAFIDDRTSKVCKSLNHKEFDLDDYDPGENAPPMHPHCRSVIAPALSALTRYDKYLKPKTAEKYNEIHKTAV